MVRPPYAVAVRLCDLAADRWAEIDAAYHASPVPLLRMKPHRFLNMVYSWAVERVPADKFDQWKLDLAELLPWQDVDSEAAINAESESFFASQARGGR